MIKDMFIFNFMPKNSEIFKITKVDNWHLWIKLTLGLNINLTFIGIISHFKTFSRVHFQLQEYLMNYSNWKFPLISHGRKNSFKLYLTLP